MTRPTRIDGDVNGEVLAYDTNNEPVPVPVHAVRQHPELFPRWRRLQKRDYLNERNQ